MSAEELSRTLTKLHSEIADTPELDVETQRALQAVLVKVQRVLDRAKNDSESKFADEEDDESSANPDANSDTVSGRLQDLIVDFEAKYPRLTLTLSQIADRLADMGI